MAFEHLGKTGVLWLMSKVKTALGTKVDKVDGKQLSTNDYTTTEKNKLAGIGAGAEANVQSDWNESVTTADAFIKNKPTSLPANGGNADTVGGFTVGASVPANAKFTDTTYTVATQTKSGLMPKEDFIKLQAFEEASNYSTTEQIDALITGKGYQTASQVNASITGKGYQTASQVESAIKSALTGITGIDIQVVQQLPTTGANGVIYLILHAHTDSGDNYDEYIWVASQSKFEKIGNTDVDLSQYVKNTDIVDITESELTAMWNS